MTKLKYIPKVLALLVVSFAFSALVQAQNYQVVSTSSSTAANNITRTVTTVQVGSNPLNRFVMTRVRKDIPGQALSCRRRSGSRENYRSCNKHARFELS